MNMYLQSLPRGGHRGPVSSVLRIQKWRTIPAAGDLREEPVFNGIELGTIRRIMNNKKSDTQFVDKVHTSCTESVTSLGSHTRNFAGEPIFNLKFRIAINSLI